jgi:hypothetical protein
MVQQQDGLGPIASATAYSVNNVSVHHNHQAVRWSSTSDDSSSSKVTHEDGAPPPQPQAHGTATITFSEKDTDDVNEASETKAAETMEEDIAALYKVVVPIRMPDMGEGKNKIVAWFKRPGDIIKRNDVLCDIQTPDFTFGMVTEDEHDSLMGEIFFEANTDEGIPDEAVICHVLHQELADGKKKKG